MSYGDYASTASTDEDRLPALEFEPSAQQQLDSSAEFGSRQLAHQLEVEEVEWLDETESGLAARSSDIVSALVFLDFLVFFFNFFPFFLRGRGKRSDSLSFS